jgi:hypothetical protein
MAFAVHLKALAREPGLTIWRVDGHAIRNRLDVEFTNGAHHFMAPYIPEDEIWLDREASPAGDEWKLWAAYQRVHRRRMMAGSSYLAALERAERAERKLRAAPRVKHGEIQERARRRVIGKAGGRKVVLVRGRVVRDLAYVHFTMGGHIRRYRWIPADEIWIDDAVAPAERPAVVLHEQVEVDLMEDHGLDYHAAHAKASAAEASFRRRQLGSGFLAETTLATR